MTSPPGLALPGWGAWVPPAPPSQCQHRPPPADPCLAGAAPRLWPSDGPNSRSLHPSVPFSCRLCQGLLGDPELGRGGVGGFPLHGRTPPCSWPRVASSMGGGQAAGLQTGPWLFIQLSELASVPLPGPGLSGVKMLSPVPTPGSDLTAGFLWTRPPGPATEQRAVGRLSARALWTVGARGGGHCLSGRLLSPCSSCAGQGPRTEEADRTLGLGHWGAWDKGTRLGRPEESCREGVCRGGSQGVCVSGEGSKGPKPLASCQHPPPAEPTVSARVRPSRPARRAGCSGGRWV